MILVTGGTGLVGAHILYYLTSKKERVRATFRDSNKKTDVLRLFKYYNPEEASKLFELIDWIQIDITDIDQASIAVNGCNEVYHTAALVSFQKKDYAEMLKTNKYGTQNLVNCSLASNVKKFAFVSSTAAIGTPKTGCANETNLWKSSSKNSNYSVTKYLAEMEVWRAANEGLNICIINPSIILGPGNINQSSTELFKTIRDGLTYYPSGSNAFVDVRDVSQLLIKMMENNYFNERVLAVGENKTFINVFNKIAKAFDVKPPSKKLPHWLANFAIYTEKILSFIGRRTPRITKESTRSSFDQQCYDNNKAKSMLDYKFRSLDDSIENAVHYFKHYSI